MSPREAYILVVSATMAVIGGLLVALVPPAATLLLVVAVAAFATVFLPGTVFALYLLIPFYKGAAQEYSPIDLTVALSLLTMLQIVPLILDRRPHQISRAGLVLWPVLAVLLLIGTLYAPDQDLALARAINWGVLLFVPIGIGALRVGSEPRFVRQLLWTFFGMGVTIALLGLTQLSSLERLEVLGANTIAVAIGALLVPLLVVVFVSRQYALLSWIAAITLIPAAVIVSLASGSRGPLLVILILAVVGLIRWLRRIRSVDRRVLGLVAAVGVASIVVGSMAADSLPGESLERFTNFGEFVQRMLEGDVNPGAGDASSAVRVSLFGYAWTLFQENPLIGVGTAGFAALSPAALGPEADVYPHNSVLQFGAEFGTLGLAIFVGFVFLAMTRLLPEAASRPVRALFLYFLLVGMVTGNVFEDRALWGLLLVVLFIDVGPVGALAGSDSDRTQQPSQAAGLLAAPSVRLVPGHAPNGRGDIVMPAQSSPSSPSASSTARLRGPVVVSPPGSRVRHLIFRDFLLPSRLDEYRQLLEHALEAGYTTLSIEQMWSLIATETVDPSGRYLIVRHDIDTDPGTAAAMWQIERELGVGSSYFFRLSTVDVGLMREIAEAGSHVSYHYEELATLAKRRHIRDPSEALARLPEARLAFGQNLERLRQATDLPMRIVASHGDFANRKLGISNTEVLADEAFRREVGVDLEAYDQAFMSHVTSRNADGPPPSSWNPEDPMTVIDRRESVVYLLVHPRNWRADRWVNVRENLSRVREGALYALPVVGGRRSDQTMPVVAIPAADPDPWPGVTLGEGASIGAFVVLGTQPGAGLPGDHELRIGRNARIRSHTVIYGGTTIGDDFQAGHGALIREATTVGDRVSVGSHTVVEHHVTIRDRVRIHSNAFIPEYSVLEEGAWIGPNVVFTNARYPMSPSAKDQL
ncbi:MAG: O-antigen ligase family protein, partial [Actinomycetota bacterium]|nr:O-antigen ligase family protein [Actinomycetota bacterium]